MNKKIFVPLILFCLVFPLLISAATICPGQECPPGAAVCIPNPLCAETFEELIEAIINFLFWVAVALAPLLVLIGAFYFMTAAGDPARIETGKRIILWTCVGLGIILFAWGLIALVKTVLGVVQ